MDKKTEDLIEEAFKTSECRIVTLKRFIIAETILFMMFIIVILFMQRYSDVDKAFQITLGIIALGGMIGAYYFKAITDEQKEDRDIKRNRS